MNSTVQAKLELLREHLHEQANAMCIQGQLVQTHLEIADDTAMTYALRRAVYHIKEAAKTANEIIGLTTSGAGDGR